jgi:large subunit ribosomal protein L30
MPEKAKSGKAASGRAKSAKTATKKATKKAADKKAVTKRAGATKATKAKKRTTERTRTAAGGSGKVRVRQVRSGIGHAETYRRTLRALGLKHHQDEVVLPDNASVRGMVFKIRHLIEVTSEEA